MKSKICNKVVDLYQEIKHKVTACSGEIQYRLDNLECDHKIKSHSPNTEVEEQVLNSWWNKENG